MARADRLRETYQRLPDERLEDLVHEAHTIDDEALGVLMEEVERRGLIVATHFVSEEDYQEAVRERARVRRRATTGWCLVVAVVFAGMAAGRAWQAGATIDLLNPLMWIRVAGVILVNWACFLLFVYVWTWLARGYAPCGCVSATPSYAHADPHALLTLPHAWPICRTSPS